ncbi:acyltransferase family protein [Hansschlegelia quercus]|uniref:Acyltransferase n=1 Tax=Hansschlegelia quercus TaxID=2528245 RepID=A0A4Q9GIV8_9HYPH|nr:acyltransferase [Hansschlegelia quercus]TBN54042.1 acyltransferase [Hansschlegelia quercus]
MTGALRRNAQLLRERPNNFTLLRILFAVAVVYDHFYVLLSAPEARYGFPWAELGVAAFFVTSGVLVTASYDEDPQLLRFWVKRLFRILPLYLLVVGCQGAVMSVIALSRGTFDLAELGHYLVMNALFMNFNAPAFGGVLDGFPTPAINPSLWTLKIELMFYAVLPLLMAVYRRLGFAWIAALFIASTLFYEYFVDAQPMLAKQLPGQIRYFAVGMAIALYFDRLDALKRPSTRILALAVIALVAVAGLVWFVPHASAFEPLFVASAVFIAAFWLPALWEPVDVSYGAYLFHAPIIQLSAVYGLYAADLLRLGALMVIVLSLAALAHIFIEKPGIKLGRAFIRASFRPNTPVIDLVLQPTRVKDQ